MSYPDRVSLKISKIKDNPLKSKSKTHISAQFKWKYGKNRLTLSRFPINFSNFEPINHSDMTQEIEILQFLHYNTEASLGIDQYPKSGNT